MQEGQVQSLGWEDALEKEMSTHSSIPAWKIPWTEEPSRIQFMALQSQTRLSTHMHKLQHVGYGENLKQSEPREN